MSHTDTHRAYAWMPALTVVMIVVALVGGTLALRYLETQLVSTKGERLALAAVSAVETLDRLLAERDGDVQMMVQVVALQSQDLIAVTSYFEQLQAAYPVYLMLSRAGVRLLQADSRSGTDGPACKLAWVGEGAGPLTAQRLGSCHAVVWG